MQTEKLLSRHALPNGLTLELWDLSRPMAGDRWQVVVEVRVDIPLTLGNLPSEHRHKVDDIMAALGSRVRFVKQEVRNFIAEKEIAALVRQIEAELLASIRGYLSHPEFAPRFIRKAYADFQARQRWYPPE